MKPATIVTLIALTLLIPVASSARHSGVVTWRWRQDSGGVGDSYWLAPSDTQVTLVGSQEKIRLNLTVIKKSPTPPPWTFFYNDLKVTPQGSVEVPYDQFFTYVASEHLTHNSLVSGEGTLLTKIITAPDGSFTRPDAFQTAMELCLKAKEDTPAGIYNFSIHAIEMTEEKNNRAQLRLEAATPSEVQTVEALEVGPTHVTIQGELLALGHTPPKEHGICWSTSPSPTISDYKKSLGPITQTKTFDCPLTDLAPDTTYHLRAYATNSAGTVYGQEITLTTPPTASETFGAGGCFLNTI